MNLRPLAPLSLALLSACSMLPFGKSKPADTAAAIEPVDSTSNGQYLQSPNSDNRKALADIHAALTALQNDPNLSTRAPDAMKKAVTAVAEADKLQSSADRPPNFVEVTTGEAAKYQVDVRPLAHLIYVADRRVQTARALAEASYYTDESAELRARRDAIRDKP
jgi:hypothetical protein